MSANDDLVVVHRASSTLLAEHLQSLLEADGVESFVDPYSAEEVVSGELYTEFTGVDVKVRARDADRARAVIEEAHRSGEILKAAGDDVETSEGAGS